MRYALKGYTFFTLKILIFLIVDIRLPSPQKLPDMKWMRQRVEHRIISPFVFQEVLGSLSAAKNNQSASRS